MGICALLTNGLGGLDYTHMRHYLCLKFYKAGLDTQCVTYAYLTTQLLRSDRCNVMCSMLGLARIGRASLLRLPICKLRNAVELAFSATCLV